MKHFTIHIFGYGETQINGDEFSVKVDTTTLTKVQPLVSAVWALKPADSEAVQDYRAINVFGYKDIRYMTKNGYGVEVTPALKTLIDDLIAELKVASDALQAPTQPNVVAPPAPNTDAPTN